MMPKAIILAVVDEADDRQVTERLLHNRYGHDYDVLCEALPEHALRRLRTLHASGREVAVLLADQWMPGMTGLEFFGRAIEWFPHARRVLLFERNDPTARQPLYQAMALGQIDYYVIKPMGEPDEAFHQIITDLLVEWTGDHEETFKAVQMVGETWDPRSHEFRDLLERNGVPHRFYDTRSIEGQAVLREAQRPEGPFPVLLLYDGRVLTSPSIKEAAEALGAPGGGPEGIYDVTIVGGGPAGLSAAVYGASEGLRTLVIEREAMGGQAGTSSRIRNYLGFPRGISGGELAQRARDQASLFGAEYFLMHEAVALRAEGDYRIVTLSDGTEVVSRSVVLATGVRYRRLGSPALEALLGAGVFYGAALSEAPAMQGQDVFVVGGGNSAGQAAVHLAKYADSVTMVVRGHSLASSMSEYLIREIEHNSKIEVALRTEVVDGSGQHRLERLVLRNGQTGERRAVDAAGLFVLIGGHPHTDWLAGAIQRDEQGYILTGQELRREDLPPDGMLPDRLPSLLETSIPGVFAVGDVRARSVKRVASTVGEGSIVIQLIHEYRAQSTTMSTRS